MSTCFCHPKSRPDGWQVPAHLESGVQPLKRQSQAYLCAKFLEEASQAWDEEENSDLRGSDRRQASQAAGLT